MLDMSYNIKIGKYGLSRLLSCEIHKSANKLSDTATIKLPGMAYSKALEIETKLKRGDEVSLELGYNETLEIEFKGYIRSITTDNTIVIEFEDGMFLMRKEVENIQYKDKSAVEIITAVVDQIGGFKIVSGKEVDFVRFDKFVVNNNTAYEVLNKIKEESGLHIFVKGDELHIHLKYTYKNKDIKYDFTKNVEKSNLKYLKAEDKKVLVEVTGINRKAVKTTVVVGDRGGDKISVKRYNVSDEKALKLIGEEEIKKHRITGFEGNITTWLFPYVSYGDSAKIIDDDYPKREGKYYVEAVDVFFNSSGGSRKVTLGIKLDD